MVDRPFEVKVVYYYFLNWIVVAIVDDYNVLAMDAMEVDVSMDDVFHVVPDYAEKKEAVIV